jgi:hypothetical protein
MVNLPPVVYQIPSMLTSYGIPPEPAPRSIAEPMPKRTPIVPMFEDVGNVGTSEILDVPSKAEILRELGDLVPEAVTAPQKIDPVELEPYKDLSAKPAPKKGLRGFEFPSPFENMPEAQATYFTDVEARRFDPEDVFTEAEAVPVIKKKAGRPKGRPNRTQEEIRQQQMDDLERKRLRAEARAIKDAAKNEILKAKKDKRSPKTIDEIRKRLNKQLTDIEDERAALEEGSIKSSEL